MLQNIYVGTIYIIIQFFLKKNLQGYGHQTAVVKIKETFWPILKMNWKIWTIFQFINVNYVPQKVNYTLFT